RRHTRFSRDWSSDVCSSDLFDAGISTTLWLALMAFLTRVRSSAIGSVFIIYKNYDNGFHPLPKGQTYYLLTIFAMQKKPDKPHYAIYPGKSKYFFWFTKKLFSPLGFFRLMPSHGMLHERYQIDAYIP